MLFKKCKSCNANLDHGEICDCRKETAEKEKVDFKRLPAKDKKPSKGIKPKVK
ncbi:MAG: hypothetical protein FWF32_07680 [Endomicrobia bacterium]|nr:hypothetical protein [Endomicrobiia bacterium]